MAEIRVDPGVRLKILKFSKEGSNLKADTGGQTAWPPGAGGDVRPQWTHSAWIPASLINLAYFKVSDLI